MNPKISGNPIQKCSSLGLPELIAIALGGMVGGGIFTILGVSVAAVGAWTPLVMIVGGLLASLAAYSYVKLGVYYLDEGATYSFFKRTFPNSPFGASLIGWWVIFGYISTLSLYASTFSSYALSSSGLAGHAVLQKGLACGVIALFALINVWSVKGMGKIEDLLVYTKLLILLIISAVLIGHAQTSLPVLIDQGQDFSLMPLLMIASMTFVAFEGFQLVINAVNEIDEPRSNIPKAIYSSIALAILIYFLIALGAVLAIPFTDIIQNQEFALSAGASIQLGGWGASLVIVGALLATSSAISGTAFGASRQVAVIAQDGYFPRLLAKRSRSIPVNAVWFMALFACLLILLADLKLILEFGSVTFLLVSLLMAWANFKIRRKTRASTPLTLLAIAGLALGTLFILFFEYQEQPEQLVFIVTLYLLLTLVAWGYAKLGRQSVHTR